MSNQAHKVNSVYLSAINRHIGLLDYALNRSILNIVL